MWADSLEYKLEQRDNCGFVGCVSITLFFTHGQGGRQVRFGPFWVFERKTRGGSAFMLALPSQAPKRGIVWHWHTCLLVVYLPILVYFGLVAI